MVNQVASNEGRLLRRLICAVFIAGLVLWTPAIAAEGEGGFGRTSLDVGLAVHDAEKVAEFYTKALGFREAEGFTMSGALARQIGLTEGTPLDVHVLVLAEDKSATRLKLVQLPENEPSVRSEKAVDSQQGFRYITVFVADMNRALKRLKDAGVKPAADGPVKLGRDSPNEVFVMLVHDPEGNLVELVGPKKDKGTP